MKYLAISLSVTVVFAVLSVCCAGAKVRYDNYHVYQLRPHTREQLQVIKKLESAVDSFIFLDAVHYLNSTINVLVAPQRVPKFVKSLLTLGIPHELVDTNAQASLGEDDVADPNTRTSDYNWKQYHTLNDTYDWLYSLEEKYPKVVSVIVVGKTYEGRDILGIKISYGQGRKAIFLESGIHAREWIAPATATYITNELLTSKDNEVRIIAESFDWYIVPHANPDGYVYTHTTNRMWRKTRSVQGKCFGVDPNRNWDFHWNEVGSSNDPCSDTYAGPYAFSEIETKSLAEFIAYLHEEIYLYVSFHAYSQLLLFPWGHTPEVPINNDDLVRVYNVAIDAISQRYGTKYVGGNINTAIYPASGASIDWAFGTQNVKYSYCYELRPSSNAFWTGFKLPAQQIIPTGEETMDSLMAMITEIGVARFL